MTVRSVEQSLMEALGNLAGDPAHRQGLSLLMDGVRLYPSLSLSHYNIADDDTIDVILEQMGD
jgi:hypothetical protein